MRRKFRGTGIFAKPRNKYGAKKTIIDNIKFDSKTESARYEILRDRQARGEISELELQKKYVLTVNGEKICTYIADFEYLDHATGAYVTEDAKGGRATITPAFRIKAKLMKAIHGIEIRIV